MMVKSSVNDGVGKMVLSHPPLNILTREVMAQLRSALADLESEDHLRVLLLTAEGKHFSAGADVSEHLPPDYGQLIPEFIETVQAIHDFPLPVVAAVQGRCLGGGFELVQAADIIVAGESAVFGQPEIVLGVFPPAACALLPRLCSPGLAAELVLAGGTIGAQEAQGAGLVRHVVADDRIQDEAKDLALRMAKHSAAALRVAKRALRAGPAGSLADGLAEAGRIYVDELMASEDAGEGLRAFLEKREPKWAHR